MIERIFNTIWFTSVHNLRKANAMKEATPAVLIRNFHRWSGLALILLVADKLVSGFRMSGAIDFPGEAIANRMHFSPWIDVLLVFFFIFHAAYGVLKMLMSRGVRKKARAFVTVNAVAFLLFACYIVFVY
jgi:succinate dehydrogenase/fumarate reductase cytochrome b subunit